MVDKTLTEYGKVDILVNNASVNRDSIISKMAEDL